MREVSQKTLVKRVFLINPLPGDVLNCFLKKFSVTIVRKINKTNDVDSVF